MPKTPQPSNSQVYQQSLIDARAAWAQKSGLTQAQVKGAYQQAATSLGSRVAAAPPTAPSTAWNLGQFQTVIQDYADTLDQRVLDAMHAGIYASYHDSADSVLKAKVSDAYGSVFGPEAIDAHVRGVNQRAAAAYITRTGKDGIKLSDRVWKANQQWRAATQSVVQNAVIAGQPPVQVARQIEQYLQPGVNVPYKAETAKRLHVPKDTSMPAMRVARTEMQNAFHEGTISSHGSMPSYLGIRWVISHGAGHVPDICDEYAATGFFPKGSEPLKPHPHCFCTAVPVHRDSADVLNDLDEWLANPSSHPDLEAYYKELQPLLDVEIASVAGAAGGPLQGGYAKGDKVWIDVKGQQVVATIKGETVSKGVLVMNIDPGQGMAPIKVWRAPSKVKPYTGPPTPAIPLQTGPPPPLVTGIQVGDTVHATAGAHTGKVGTVLSVNQMGGTYHVQWTDGTANNVVHQNVQKAPPPPALLPGDMVKINMPEVPQVHGQVGSISKINADGSYTVAVTSLGAAFDLPHLASFKLELIPPGAPLPSVTPPPILGYLDAPGSSHHGKKVIGQPYPSTVMFEDGSYGHVFNAANIVPNDPLAAPPPPPPAPIPTPQPAPFGLGDHIQIDDPTLAVHGQQGVIEQVTPTQIQVKMADGNSFFLHPDDLFTSVKPLATTPVITGPRPEAGIDDLTSFDPVYVSAGTHVGKKLFLGDETPAWYSPTQEVALYASLADAHAADSPIFVAKKDFGTVLGFLKHTEPPLHQLHMGDAVEIKIGAPSGGQIGKLQTDVIGLPADATVPVLLSDGSTVHVYLDELHKPPPPPPPTHVPPLQGTAAQIDHPIDSMHGEQVIIAESKPGALADTPIKVTFTSGPNIGDSDWFPLKTLMPPGTPITPAAPGAPVVVHTPPGAAAVDVTVKGTKVVTDYKGVRNITGTVTSWNPGKNVLVIKPDDPTLLAGAPKPTFTKNPKYVKAIVPPGTTPPPTPASAQQAATPPPPQGVNHLKKGDIAHVNMPGSPLHGNEVILTEDLAGKAPGDEVVVIGTLPNGTQINQYHYVHDLVAPGQPLATTPPPGSHAVAPPTAADFTVGDTVTIAGLYDGVVTHVTPNTVEVNVAGFGVIPYDTPMTIASITKVAAAPVVPPGTPTVTPPPVVPTQTVTTKGALVQAEYHGQIVQATVTSFNANKNVVKLKPLTPGPGLPPFFEKSPGKVSLITPPSATAAQVPLTPTVAPPAHPAQPPSPTHLPPDPPKPNTGQFTVKPQTVGGGHQKTIYSAPDGATWMFKPDVNAAQAEKAGYNVQKLLGLATPEMHVLTHGGQVGSMQKFHDGIKGEVTFNSLPSLTAQQRADIQQHQVIDWLISQHDSNQGAMLIGADDHILAVDKGQAFKFLISPGDKLHWTYAPNPDSVVYKPLFEGYIGNKFDLKRADIEPLIARIEALSDDVFKEAIRPYAEHAAAQGFVSSPEVIYDKLIKRKHTIREDFDKLYDEADALAGRSSGPSLRQVQVATPQAPVAVMATSTASANVVTPITQTLANDVKRAGTHGKTVMVGGTDIENGAVYVYEMKVSGDGTRLIVSAKVRADAEKKLTNHLDGLPAPGTPAAPSYSYTPPPAADPAWGTTLKMLKHFNTHLKAGADGVLTPGNLQELITLAKQIAANSNNWTAHKSQYYADLLTKITGTTDIAQLTNLDVPALDAKIKATWTNNATLLGASFNEYVAPVAPVPTPAAAPPPTISGKFQARKAVPSYPQRTLVNGDLVTDGTRTSAEKDGIVGDHEWFVDNLGPGMSMQYMPHYGHASTYHSNNPYARHGRLDITIDNWQGDSAAIEHGLAKLKELGLDADPATPKDVELLYLVHQVHALKLEQAQDYQTMQAGINDSTPVDERIAKYQDYLSKKLGKDVSKMPTYQPVAKFVRGYRVAGGNGHEMVEDVGRPYFERIDITSADLKREMPQFVLTHRATSGTEGFLTALLNGNGHASPSEERVRQALFDKRQGMSSVDDMYTGGASYFFTRLAKKNTNQAKRGAFHFSTDLLLQTDILAYDHDSFGQSDPTTKRKRNTTIAEWKATQHVDDYNEVIIKDGFPVLDYLERLSAGTSSERDRFIKMFKDRGIDQIRGKKIEDIVQVGF